MPGQDTLWRSKSAQNSASYMMIAMKRIRGESMTEQSRMAHTTIGRKRLVGIFKHAQLMSLVVLASCARVPSDAQKGPVILQCVGTLSIESPLTGSSEKEWREVYRVNGPEKKFEIWNGDTETWKVDDGFDKVDLIVDKDYIRYNGSGVISGTIVFRNVEFRRSSGNVVDQTNLIGIAKRSFIGACKPVAKPKRVKPKF